MSTSSDDKQPTLTHIDKLEMMEIISHLENDTGDKTYVVIDVRNDSEILATGKVSLKAHTLPLPIIASQNAFALEPDDFEELFGFEKPEKDVELVLTCKAGIRSQQAAQFAAMNGYTNLINYMGGADEWFGGGQGW